MVAEEQPHVKGAVAVPRGATPCSRSGGEAVRRYPLSKVRKEQQLRFTGAAMKRYPTSKVRETQVSKTVGIARGHQRADTLKP